MHKKKELPWEAQLNIIANKLGHIARKQLMPKNKKVFHLLPVGKVYLFIDGQPITRNIKQAIHNTETVPELRKYIINKFQLPEKSFDNINECHFG
eukprot:1985879-Ditylum_brightwellii.AAC.2